VNGSVLLDRVRQCAPHLIRASFGRPETTSQTTSESVQPCLHGSWQSVIARMPRHVLSPKNSVFTWGDLDPHRIHDFLAHSSLNGKWRLDWFSRLCTAHGRELLYFTMGRPISFLKLSLPMGDLNSHLIHGFLAIQILMVPLAHPNPQPKRHLDRFSHSCTAHSRVSLYFTINRPSPCQNCPFLWGDLDPIYCMVPWAHPLNPNSISIS